MRESGGGDGLTPETAFLVYNVTTLRKVGDGNTDGNGNNWALDASYKLISDITLPSVAEGQSNWTRISGNSNTHFIGNFNGNGHTISNLTINDPADYQGMFFYLGQGGTVENLTLSGVRITGGQFTGGIAGQAMEGTTIENCVALNGQVTGVIGVCRVAGTADGGILTNNYGKKDMAGFANSDDRNSEYGADVPAGMGGYNDLDWWTESGHWLEGGALTPPAAPWNFTTIWQMGTVQTGEGPQTLPVLR